MICPKCAVEYEESERVFQSCGSDLLKPLPKDGSHVSKAEEMRIVRVCPSCHLHYEIGNYCRRCGSILEQKEISHIREPMPGQRLLRSLFAERVCLEKKKKELEICIKNLEANRAAFSEGFFGPTFQRYQAQMEALFCRLREIESEFETIRARASKEIESLQEEIRPIRERIEEIRSLRRLGAIPRSEYIALKNEMTKEMNGRERRLKEYRRTISFLAKSSMGAPVAPLEARSYLRNQLLPITLGVMILLVLGANFLWPNMFSPRSKHVIDAPQTKSSEPMPYPSALTEVQERERIKQLFEMIRQANLQKKIDLFMSCYTTDLRDRNGKRMETMETWNHFDYLDLSYNLERQAITGHTAQVRVEWWIKVSQKSGGPSQERRSVFDVTLKKEDGRWKIGEIKPIA